MVSLYIGAREYDITDYIDESSLVYSDNIDETRAHGGVTIPFIKPNILTGLDMSKPLPRLTPFVIVIDEVYTYWKLSEDRVNKVRKGDNPLYSHEITLIEPTVDLENRPMPDLTVTQPQGILDNWIYDINTLADEVTIVDAVSEFEIASGYEPTGILVNNTIQTLGFDYGTSNDATVIDENELLEVREYTIQLNYEIYNIQSLGLTPNADLELTVYADTTLLYTYTTAMPKATVKYVFGTGYVITPYSKLIRQSFQYTPSGVGELITIKARTTGLYTIDEPDEPLPVDYEDELWITKFGFNILTYEEGETAKTMLDEVVEKILLVQRSAPLDYPTQEFTLATATKTRLSTIPSPEFKFSGYTMFDDLNEVASYVGAIVYIGEDDFTTVHFYFYDDESVESDIEYLEEEQNVYLQDYVTAFEINAQNVINEDNIRYVAVEPSETGWLSIRANDVETITDDNAVLQTSKPFYKNNKLIAKGLAFTMKDSLDADVTFASTLEWDLSNWVVEQTRWNALPNQALDTRSGVKNKGNTLYYTQGEKMLKGLGYNDVILAPAWTPALSANYAIVEAILCQAAVENPTYTFVNDYKPTISLFDMLFRIYYMPYSNARVSVYRDDAATLNKSERYFNEQASINDMKALGDTAKRHVNLKGNSVSTYRGIATNIYNLINLGMKNDRGEVLTSYELAPGVKLREFVLHYSKDNPNISAYKGVPSAYRQYQIPTSDLVYRKDKYSEFVYFTETDETTVYTIYDTDQILANFQPTPAGLKLTYAVVELDYTGAGYTETVEATVDTLAFGNTSALVIEMQDNYSAGFKQEVDGSIIRNNAVPYVDDYGKIENVKITTFTTKITDSDEYPDNDTTTTTGFESQLELVVKKDAREIWGVTQELVFRSIYSNIKIFSGMAKFNGLVALGSTVEPRPFLLKSGYFPVNETIDFSRLRQPTWDSTITGNQWTTEMDVPAGTYEGYIWIEMSTKTPIMAVKTTAFDSLTAATLDHSIYTNVSYEKVVSNYGTSLTDGLDITDSMSTSQFVYPVFDFTDGLDITDSMVMYQSTDYVMDLTSALDVTDTMVMIQSTDFVIDLEDTYTLEETLEETQFLFPILDFTDGLDVTDSMNVFKSTNYVIDLSDTYTIESAIGVSQLTSEYKMDLLTSLVLLDTIILSQSTQFNTDLTTSLTLSDSLSVYKGTYFTDDLTTSLTLSDSLVAYKSTNYVINLTDTISLTSSIATTQVQQLSYVIDISDTISLTSVMSDTRTASNWTYIGTTGTYDKAVTYSIDGTVCPTTSGTDSWLEVTYPAEDYAYGYVIRVTRATNGGTLCIPVYYYYQAS